MTLWVFGRPIMAGPAASDEGTPGVRAGMLSARHDDSEHTAASGPTGKLTSSPWKACPRRRAGPPSPFDGPRRRKSSAAPASAPAVVSIVVPVYDEAENVRPLLDEIAAMLDALPPAEVIYVDDGSGPETRAVLDEVKRLLPELRVLRHAANYGQSAAIRTGVQAAHGRLIATLDGDGQNDPADLPRLVRRCLEAPADARLGMVAGQRLKRQDSWSKRQAGRIANRVSAYLLGGGVPDTGCGLKVFRRDLFLALPYFDHMHRFLPVLARREGFEVVVEPVSHRPRAHGRSKYGVVDRLLFGIVDLMGVMWLRRRLPQPIESKELRPVRSDRTAATD